MVADWADLLWIGRISPRPSTVVRKRIPAVVFFMSETPGVVSAKSADIRPIREHMCWGSPGGSAIDTRVRYGRARVMRRGR